MTLWRVSSSMLDCEKVKTGSGAGLGDADLTLWSLSLGVSLLLFGRVKKTDGFGDEDDWERVTRVLASGVAAEVVVAVASLEAGVAVRIAASSACSSSPHGHM